MGNLISVIPAILGFLGGPAGGLAGAGLEWLANKFGAKDSTVDSIKQILEGFKPSDTITLRKLDIEFQEFCMQHNIALQLAQLEVDKIEAASDSVFVAGWRPFIGWVGGAGIAYAAIIFPFAEFIAKVGFKYTGVFPVLDTGILMQVVMAMLGMGLFRTMDKKNGKNNGY